MKKIAVIENHALASATIRNDLMKAIRNSGYELYILTGDSGTFLKLKKEGFNMINVGSSIQNPFAVFSYLKSLKRTLKKIKPDVCLTFTIRPGIYGNLVTKKLQIPTISNITGIGPLFENNGLTYRIARFLYPIALKETSKVFFQNFDDLNIFVAKGFVKKANTIRIPGSGINYNLFVPRKFTGLEDSFSFMFISRLVKDKGLLDYVEAARIVKQLFPDAIFFIVGPYWDQNVKSNTISELDVKQWEDEGIITYLGEANDVRDYIEKAHCVVLPSYREGTSNVLLESASMAKPLIATNVTGCKEIIKDEITGYLCEVKNPKDLADKMLRMINLSNKDRLKMGELGRDKVIKEYDKKIVVNAYLEAIEDLTA